VRGWLNSRRKKRLARKAEKEHVCSPLVQEGERMTFIVCKECRRTIAAVRNDDLTK
jgi:hypothetical protein